MHDINKVLSNSTDASTQSIEVGEGYQFCAHGLESCQECSVDFREDNEFTALGDSKMADKREPLSIEFALNAEGTPICKRHKSVDCNTCFGLKKQINKSVQAAKKAGKNAPKSSSNFY